MLVQKVQYYICICIFSQINTDPHAFTAGVIVKICNSINLFISYKLRDLRDQTCFIYQVWKFRNNNPGFAVGQSFNICHCTHTDLATSCAVCFFDSSSAQDRSSCREIRTFYYIQDLLHSSISLFFYDIINDLYNCIDHFSQIMRRDIGRHTYCNT